MRKVRRELQREVEVNEDEIGFAQIEFEIQGDVRTALYITGKSEIKDILVPWKQKSSWKQGQGSDY